MSARDPGGEGPGAAGDRDSQLEGLALRLLASREHSRLELGRKLRARGFTPDQVDVLLTRLCASGTLDESRLVEVYVAERQRKGFGPLRIRAELAEKGLPDALIAPHLSDDAADWLELLAAAHDRRFGADAPADRADFARRGRFLEQRGFPVEMIRRYLRWND